MRFRRVLAMLVATVLIVGACSSNTPSPSPSGPAGSAGPSQGPTASGPASTGPAGSPVAGTPGPSAGETPEATPSGDPGPSATPKPPKPLPAYITHGKRNGTDKLIALTFDADMYPFMYATRDSYHEYDPRVLKLIKDNDLHATVFLNGLYVKAYPEIIKDLAKSPGIEFGSHTWDHADWTACSDPAAPPLTDKKAEITKVTNIVKDVLDRDIDWFRFPGGCYGGTADLNLVKSYGQWPVGWDCYFGDSLGWNGDQEFANVKNTCKNGSIVITHLDNTKYHPGIYDALKQLIPWWKKNGWTVVNMTELMGQSPPKP